MKKRIVGIFIIMLVMTSAAITAAGLMNIDDSQEINEPNENIPFPSAADTGYLSIPAGAFIPVSEFESYTNNGFEVFGNAVFTAPVCLPHGATVTELIFHWGDASPSYDGQLSLCVNYMTGWSDLMAECDTSGSSGQSSNSFDNTIDHAEIDNFHHSYYLRLITGAQIACFGAIIKYTCPTVNNLEDIPESQQTHEPDLPLSR